MQIIIIIIFFRYLCRLIIYYSWNQTVRAFTTDLLQRKVKGLEDDNRKLRAEASQLANESSETELREEQLLHQVVAQLGTVKRQQDHCCLPSSAFTIPLPAAFLWLGSSYN